MSVLTYYFMRMATGPLLRPREEFCCEIFRIDSFQKFPKWSPVSTLKLAKSGFSFNGTDDEVTCFSCGGRLGKWQYGEEPNVRHQQSFPNCSYMNGNDTSNVPLDCHSNHRVGCSDFDISPADANSSSNPHHNDLASSKDEDEPLTADEMTVKEERSGLQKYTGQISDQAKMEDMRQELAHLKLDSKLDRLKNRVKEKITLGVFLKVCKEIGLSSATPLVHLRPHIRGEALLEIEEAARHDVVNSSIFVDIYTAAEFMGEKALDAMKECLITEIDRYLCSDFLTRRT